MTPDPLPPVAAARRWADTWKDAWEALDTDRIVALYAPGAVFSSEPFRDPHQGDAGVRGYVGAAFAEEEQLRVHMSEPIVDGDRASVSWWASLVEAGRPTTLAGTSVLRLDPDGLVVEQWDSWNVRAERGEPPSWAPF